MKGISDDLLLNFRKMTMYKIHLIKRIKKYADFVQKKIKWRKVNFNNNTIIVRNCDINRISVGDYSYGALDVESFGAKDSFLKIGRFCSIAGEVRFLIDGEHEYKSFSTFPFKVNFYNQKSEAGSKGPIIVEDDVWIGERSLILSGVRIGQGAIIGAGSIVTKDVPPYSIYINNGVLRYRFDDDCVQKLLKVDFSRLTSSIIKSEEFIKFSSMEVNKDFFNSRLYKYLSHESDTF